MSQQTKKAGLAARLRALFRPADETDAADIRYEGSAILRILRYMKPHLGTFLICLGIMALQNL